ncbi:MAG: energy transducer TonB [Desulfobulbus sp.]|nr:energy transducer TonB [Desulfobulbus sp.]
MSTQSKSFHLSLLFHLALAAVLFYGHQLLEEDTPPLVIDFSLALSEAMAGEPDQPPGPPAGATKAPAPQPQTATPEPKPVTQPVHKPTKIAKQKSKVQTTKPKKVLPKKLRKEPSPMVETSTTPAAFKAEPTVAESAATAEASSTPAASSATAPPATGSPVGPSAASSGAGAKGGRRGGGGGMGYDFNYVRQRILRNLQFPATARKMGLSGKIVVSFVLKANGQVEGITVVSSSGHDILDRSVVATIRRIAPFPKPPVSAQLMLPIVFHLKS